MATWVDVVNGAGMIARGLHTMGVTGDVHVALTPEDGEQLETAFQTRTTFSDITLPGQATVRTCTLGGVHFRWLKR
jgi:hypothetical protein